MSGSPVRRRRETPDSTGGVSLADWDRTATESPASPSLSHDTLDLPGQLRRRRAASYRMQPHGDGFRDPLDRLASPPGPSDFGLCRAELRAEVARCRQSGWADWEIVARLANPDSMARSRNRGKPRGNEPCCARQPHPARCLITSSDTPGTRMEGGRGCIYDLLSAPVDAACAPAERSARRSSPLSPHRDAARGTGGSLTR
jgi:hypothetical protein